MATFDGMLGSSRRRRLPTKYILQEMLAAGALTKDELLDAFFRWTSETALTRMARANGYLADYEGAGDREDNQD